MMFAMADPQDLVDIPGITNPAAQRARSHSDPQGKRWLGVLFNCCHVYARIHRDERRRRYAGRCPRCGAEITVPIGPAGTNRRFFETT